MHPSVNAYPPNPVFAPSSEVMSKTLQFAPNTPEVAAFIAGLNVTFFQDDLGAEANFSSITNSTVNDTHTRVFQELPVAGYASADALQAAYLANRSLYWGAVIFDDGTLPLEKTVSYTIRMPEGQVPSSLDLYSPKDACRSACWLDLTLVA